MTGVDCAIDSAKGCHTVTVSGFAEESVLPPHVWEQYLQECHLATQQHVAMQTKMTAELIRSLHWCPSHVRENATCPSEPGGSTAVANPEDVVLTEHGTVAYGPMHSSEKHAINESHFLADTVHAARRSTVKSYVSSSKSSPTSEAKASWSFKDSMGQANLHFLTDTFEEIQAATAGFAHRTELHLEEKDGVLVKTLKHALGEESLMTKHCSVMSGIEHEVERSGVIADVVRSKFFHCLSAVIILSHTFLMVAETNASMSHAYNDSLTEEFSRLLYWIEIIDLAFLVFYILELVMRLYVYRCTFFCNTEAIWNWLDILLVASSLMGILLATQESGFGDTTRLLAMRNTRIFKLAKLLRLVRAVRFVKQLQLFVDIVLGCCESLFWAIMMILLVLLLFAIYFVQVMERWIRANVTPDASDEIQLTGAAVKEMFGSVEVAMLTLSKAISGGMDWETSYAVAEKTGPWNAAAFLTVIAFFSVAIWNIVASVFIENTISSASLSRDEQAMAQHRSDVQDAKELMHLCRIADLDKSGTLSAEEFHSFMESAMIRDFFVVRGLDIKNAEHFFEMMNAVSEGEELELEHFVGACLRVKGAATSIDLHMLAFDHKVMAAKMRKFISFAHVELLHLSRKIDAILAHSGAQQKKKTPRVGPKKEKQAGPAEGHPKLQEQFGSVPAPSDGSEPEQLQSI
eukprot:TRINITY_DN31819_c1_g1_i1.p1 TRINITY_DN31819_c1_g1~~TRINITY_DN31819_c1_g1_i1.p1  ORF type:complete len:688 (-),score=124.38 TRINITY_DN31819_c1_g1_i1:157-2220(-)